DLWRLLAVIAARKAIDQVNHQRRQKRGGGRVRGESILIEFQAEGGTFGMADLARAESSPDFIDTMAAECQHLLAQLDDEQLKELALLKMEGFTNEEIAAKLDCARRTVQRRLKLIQEIWTEASAL
ncbi:MAG: ECF-type sigma factor, partial [Planctomycetaceae bacterium]